MGAHEIEEVKQSIVNVEQNLISAGHNLQSNQMGLQKQIIDLSNKLNVQQEKIEINNPFSEDILGSLIDWDVFLSEEGIGYFWTIPATVGNYNVYLRLSPFLNSTIESTKQFWNIHHTLTIEEKNTNDTVRGAVGSSIRGEIVDFVEPEKINSYVEILKQNKMSLHFLITGQKGDFRNATKLVLNEKTIEIS